MLYYILLPHNLTPISLSSTCPEEQENNDCMDLQKVSTNSTMHCLYVCMSNLQSHYLYVYNTIDLESWGNGEVFLWQRFGGKESLIP